MATGLFVTDDGNVMVDYGKKKIPIPLAQYKANGYRPRFEELMLRVQAEQRLRSVSLPEQETTRTQPAHLYSGDRRQTMRNTGPRQVALAS